MPSKAARFRMLHDGPDTFIVPNPWDVGTARIFAALGSPALATTSAGLAFSHGVPEGHTTRAELLAHCASIVAATPLPVSADLENGFADSAEGVAETIRAAAATGLAGGSIEDHTGDRDKPIYDFTLALERIQAAVEACRALPGDFVLTARCENYLWNRPDLDDTIRRLQAFEAAGADVLYAPALPDIDAIRTLCSSVQRPVNVVIGMGPTRFTMAELAQAGVKRISIGSSLARLAYGAVARAAQEMAETGTFGFTSLAMGFAELEGFFTPPADR